MKAFNWQKELDRKEHRLVFSGQPFAMHCHHYNINLQKMLEETLGTVGIELLYSAAEATSYHNFSFLLSQYNQIRTLKSKLEMAATMYQNCGMGIISYQKIGPQGGQVVSPASHHVTGWLAKHGRRDTPGCHFARGWIAGMLEAIFEHTPGYYDITELRCKMKRDVECVFDVRIK